MKINVKTTCITFVKMNESRRKEEPIYRPLSKQVHSPLNLHIPQYSCRCCINSRIGVCTWPPNVPSYRWTSCRGRHNIWLTHETNFDHRETSKCRPPTQINVKKHVANQQYCYNYMHMFQTVLDYLNNVNPNVPFCIQEIFKVFPKPTDVTELA